MEKKITFVARNGTEFPSESDCLEYEARLNMNGTVLLNVHFETCGPDCPYDTVTIVVHTNMTNKMYYKIKRELHTVLNTKQEEDFESIVYIALGHIPDLKWGYFNHPVNNVVGIYDIYIRKIA